MPSINPQIRSRHIRIPIPQKKHSCRPILLDVRHSAQHIPLGPQCLQPRPFLKRRNGHRRENISRTERIHSDWRMDTVIPPFRRQVASKLEHGGLGSVVRACVDALLMISNAATVWTALRGGSLTRLTFVPDMLATITILPEDCWRCII